VCRHGLTDYYRKWIWHQINERERTSKGHGDDSRWVQLPILMTLDWLMMISNARFKWCILSLKLYPWTWALRVTESSCWKADVADLVTVPMTLALWLARGMWLDVVATLLKARELIELNLGGEEGVNYALECESVM
jgi:hypothetical protein